MEQALSVLFYRSGNWIPVDSKAGIAPDLPLQPWSWLGSLLPHGLLPLAPSPVPFLCTVGGDSIFVILGCREDVVKSCPTSLPFVLRLQIVSMAPPAQGAKYQWPICWWAP